jgi:2-iminobutanoate/2-iminopropanoate deaminase
MQKNCIRTPLGPSAIGPYSQAVRVGSGIFVSGQIAFDPSTGQLIEAADVASQTRRVLLNIKGILSAAGASMKHVVRTTVYLKDMNDFAAMNAAYAEFFPVEPPARSTVEVSRLPRDARIEIDCIAVL